MLSIYSPSSDIAATWSLSGAASHSQAVLADDEDTSFIFNLYSALGLDVWGGSFDFAITDGATIDLVTSKYRVRTTNTNSVAEGSVCSSVVRINGVNYIINFGMEFAGITYHNAQQTWPTNPATGVPWVAADLGASFHGIGINKDVSEFILGQVRVTRGWLEVMWTPALAINVYDKRQSFVVSGTGKPVVPNGSARSITPAGVAHVEPE